MTMLKNVTDAVEYMDRADTAWAGRVDEGTNPHKSWQTIRAELHRLTDRLEAADALLRRCFVYSPEFVEVSPWTLQHDIEQHLQGAGDKAYRRTPEQAE